MRASALARLYPPNAAVPPGVTTYRHPVWQRAEHFLHELSHAALLFARPARWWVTDFHRLTHAVTERCADLFDAGGAREADFHELEALAVQERVVVALGCPIQMERVFAVVRDPRQSPLKDPRRFIRYPDVRVQRRDSIARGARRVVRLLGG